MADIKTRDVIKGTVKTIDKAVVASERIKDTAIKGRPGASDNSSDSSPNAYATDKLSGGAKSASPRVMAKTEAAGRHSAVQTKDAIINKRAERKAEKIIPTESDKHTKGTVSHSNYSNNRKLSKTKYQKDKQINAITSKRPVKTDNAVKREKRAAGYLKSIREIAASFKTLVLGLTAAGWLCAIMIAIVIFVGGTINVIDVLSVEPNQPGMDDWDKKYLEEILAEYPNGYIGPGDGNIVHVAQSQVGNVGGRRYWYWYGFRSHVAWCACFVSWCADQCGYIEKGIIPKFSNVNPGSEWFKKRGLWQSRGYKPKPGQIIFFRWHGDTGVSHVGIVKGCDGKRVYTIEGNSHDRCREKSYSINSAVILGYGCPKYRMADKDKKNKSAGSD